MASLSVSKCYGKGLLERLSHESDIYSVEVDMSSLWAPSQEELRELSNVVNLGICEQNAVGFAAGLAAFGYQVIVNGIPAFLLRRAFDQVFVTLGYSGYPVFLAGHYGGVFGTAGASHHCFCDFALMRNVPGCRMYCASSAEAAYFFGRYFKCDSLAYCRFDRYPTELPPLRDETFECGSLDSGIAVFPLKRTTVVTYGMTAPWCAEIVSRLQEEGVAVGLLVLYRLDNTAAIAGRLAGCSVEHVLIIEPHTWWGGVADALVRQSTQRESIFTVLWKGIPDTYGVSAQVEELYEYLELGPSQIEDWIRRNI